MEKPSSARSRIATYNCDSCGRVATRERADKLSRCCNKTTKTSVEIAAEIPIPKCEFGTDFIAVVCRGKLVDILLLSDRTSVYNSIDGWGVPAYVNNLHLGDEFREPTDIEVNYGNNVYLVRLTDGVPEVLIPAMRQECHFGDWCLSMEERDPILTLAQNNTPSERMVEFMLGRKTLRLLIKKEIAAKLSKENMDFGQHPYHRTALAFGYIYQSQMSSEIEVFLYTHQVGHSLEFAKLAAENWKHTQVEPNWKRETGRDHGSLITYLLARNDLNVIADSTPATNLLASPDEVPK